MGGLQVRGRGVPALALSFVAAASFTGEDVVELHVPGSPLLVQCMLEDLLQRGASLGLRAALPGEFTARAFRNGKLDGAAVEGLLCLLHAQDQRAVAAALPWLTGGLGLAVGELRSGLQDVLAELEAGLDFSDGETGSYSTVAVAAHLAALAQRCGRLLAAVPQAAPGGAVLLLGASNIGKSSLANALAGRPSALVADQPGTTRDVLAIELAPGALIWDAPGDLAAAGPIESAALALRDRLAGRAAAVAVVLDAADPAVPPWERLGLPVMAVVWTRVDRVAALPPMPGVLSRKLVAGTPVFATSAKSGTGIAELRNLLVQSGATGGAQAGAPLRTSFTAVGSEVQNALAVLEEAPELAAAAVQAALRALDGVDGGQHSAEQVLDRIYGRFCLGK